MSDWKFPRMGWVTFGNPNHYDGSGLLLRELRARCRDEDLEPGQRTAIADLERGFKEDYGVKLTEDSAVKHNMGDVIADLLSDMAPEGVVFEIRKNAGNSNYGYFSTKPERWSHAFDFAFEVESAREDGEDITPEMLKAGLLKRLESLDQSEDWLQACGRYDSHKVED